MLQLHGLFGCQQRENLHHSNQTFIRSDLENRDADQQETCGRCAQTSRKLEKLYVLFPVLVAERAGCLSAKTLQQRKGRKNLRGLDMVDISRAPVSASDSYHGLLLP